MRRWLVQKLVLGLETRNPMPIKVSLDGLAKGCTGMLLVFDRKADAQRFAGTRFIIAEITESAPTPRTRRG